MNKVNRLVICRDKFKDEAEFESNIKDAILLLLENDYIMTVRYDDPGFGIVVIEYNYADQSFGDIYPYWLSATEIDSVIFDDERKDAE